MNCEQVEATDEMPTTKDSRMESLEPFASQKGNRRPPFGSPKGLTVSDTITVPGSCGDSQRAAISQVLVSRDMSSWSDTDVH